MFVSIFVSIFVKMEFELAGVLVGRHIGKTWRAIRGVNCFKCNGFHRESDGAVRIFASKALEKRRKLGVVSPFVRSFIG
jgi:hypothetical protein